MSSQNSKSLRTSQSWGNPDLPRYAPKTTVGKLRLILNAAINHFCKGSVREFAAQIGHSGKLDFICGQQSKQKVTGMWDNLPRNSKGVLKPSKVRK